MARYKQTITEQTKLIPISYAQQILPGTFEHTLNHLIDNELDISIFSKRYNNDVTGAPAWNPSVLLKIVLFAYSRGIISSRKIAQYCGEHVVFMALSSDSRPHFTTIADFISSMNEEIIVLFRNVLMVCSEMKLIDGTMFAIDGCKMPSNASKEWSGTKSSLLKKKEKIEKTLHHIIKQHKLQDANEATGVISETRHDEQINRLKEKVRKLEKWLKENDDKPGSRGKIKQSNVTDNESAKIKSSHGVIQGYNGIAVVDSKHQVVVYGEVFGQGSEHDLLEPAVRGAASNLQTIGNHDEPLKDTIVIADTGYSSEAGLEFIKAEKIDAYIPDVNFRKRDKRFATAGHHKGNNKRYTHDDFKPVPGKNAMMCPAGKTLAMTNRKETINGIKFGTRYLAKERDCSSCRLRRRCLKNNTSRSRSLFITKGSHYKTQTDLMIEKIDTEKGRRIYSRRMGIIEPVFGNIRGAKRLNRFTLRSKQKVNIQWLLYTMVHNIEKINHYGELKHI